MCACIKKAVGFTARFSVACQCSRPMLGAPLCIVSVSNSCWTAAATTAADHMCPFHAQASAWASIRRRLAPGGRVMTNLGAAPVAGMMGRPDPAVATTRQALAAMAEAFEGEARLNMCSCSSCCQRAHAADFQPNTQLLLLSALHHPLALVAC